MSYDQSYPVIARRVRSTVARAMAEHPALVGVSPETLITSHFESSSGIVVYSESLLRVVVDAALNQTPPARRESDYLQDGLFTQYFSAADEHRVNEGFSTADFWALAKQIYDGLPH